MNTLAQTVEFSQRQYSVTSLKALEGQLEQLVVDLLHCCSQVRPTTAVAQRISLLASQVDASSGWQVLVQLAIDHRVLPLVSHNLLSYAQGQVPADLKNQLKYQAQRNQLRVLGLTGSLVKVLEQLREQGIVAVPFKGLMLSLEAYGSSALRSFDDIDLWVSSENFFALEKALSSQGYVPFQTSLSTEMERQYCWDMGEYSLLNRESEVGLDVHHRLIAGDCSMTVDFSCCWHRAEEVQVMGHSVSTLRREDLVIYLCANGMKDGWSCLRSVCDVAALMTHDIPLDWDVILQEAKSMKALRMVRLGVMLAHRLLDVPLPTQFDQLNPDAMVRRMCDRICLRLSSPERPDAEEQAALEKLVLRFLASETLAARWAYLGRVLSRVFKVATHVTAKDRQFLDLPQRWNFLYYVVRPVRVLYEHHLNLFTVSGYRMFR